MKRKLITDIENHTEDEDTILLYREYQDILRNQNAIDYDDLLFLAHKIFTDFPKIASLYRRSFFAICVDEAQDLNYAQYQFLRALTNNELKNLFNKYHHLLLHMQNKIKKRKKIFAIVL